MSTDTQTAVWNNVLGHFNGTKIYTETFYTSRIKEGEIKFLNGETNNNTIWRTETTYHNGKPYGLSTIYGTGAFLEKYEATVENIASSLLVHEWYSHAIRNFSDDNRTHRFAYFNVINWKPLWDKTTDLYKRHVLTGLLHYVMEETGVNNTGLIYWNLYIDSVKSYNNGISH